MLLKEISYVIKEVSEGKKTFTLHVLNIRGSAYGTAETATQTVYDYIKNIENLEMFKDILNKAQLDSMVRDDDLGLFNFTMVIELKPEE